MQCTCLQARGRLRDASDCVDGVRDGNMGGRLASPNPFLGAPGYKSCIEGNRTRFLRMCMPRVTFYLSFVLSLLVAERNRLSFVYVLAMYMAIQTALFLYTSGRSTDSVMDSDDRLSYTVPIDDLTMILQSTR